MKDKIPLWYKVVYILSIIVAFHFFLPLGVREKTAINVDIAQVSSVAYDAIPTDLISGRVINTFTGKLTGYGPDCKGCSGRTSFGYDVTNGNIYYYDSIYGEVRIVAADSKYAFGTIVRINAPNIMDNPILAVVLDRGGVIKNNKFDLLFASEEDTRFVGLQENVTYEILRIGW